MSKGHYIALTGLFFLFSSAVWSQPSAQELIDHVFSDSSVITEVVTHDSAVAMPLQVTEDHQKEFQSRSFNEKELERYRKDSDFIYEEQHLETESWWERFKTWLAEKIFWWLSQEEGAQWVNWIIYIFIAVVFVYVVLKILKMDRLLLFYRGGSSQRIDYSEEHENIHEMNFDQLIRDAVTKEEYRKAIRLCYLKTLKELTDQELIVWKKDKTNYQYVKEIQSEPLKQKFSELTMIFEYAWYGDFNTTKEEYEWAERKFSEFNQTLQAA